MCVVVSDLQLQRHRRNLVLSLVRLFLIVGIPRVPSFWQDGFQSTNLPLRAEQAGFDVLLTADQNMRYQQNLSGRSIAIVVLSTPQWPVVRLYVERIAAAVDTATTGSYAEVILPRSVP